MKYIHILFVLILLSNAVKGQDVVSSKRDISLMILDNRGRPVDQIIVRTINNTHTKTLSYYPTYKCKFI